MIPFTSRSVEEAFASTETANIANVEITATFKNVASTYYIHKILEKCENKRIAKCSKRRNIKLQQECKIEQEIQSSRKVREKKNLEIV